MNIEILYPEVCNLYGDLFNIKYLKESYPEINIIETHLNDTPLFSNTKPDMIYMCSSSERSQQIVADKLMVYSDRIGELINDNALFFVTGNALEVFGNSVDDANGTHMDGLGIFDIYTKRDLFKRTNSLYVGKFDDIDIVGYKSQFTFSYYNSELTPLFNTLRGYSFNPSTKNEGIYTNNFIATYVIGPLLVLNPPFAKIILNKMGIENPVLAFEQEATLAYTQRVAEYTNPKNGIYY